MGNDHYPIVDTSFIIKKLLESSKIIPESQLKIGSVTTFVIKGDKPMHKRIITIREIDGSMNFMQATGLAILYGFMGELLIWYEANKKWKEGGYFE